MAKRYGFLVCPTAELGSERRRTFLPVSHNGFVFTGYRNVHKGTTSHQRRLQQKTVQLDQSFVHQRLSSNNPLPSSRSAKGLERITVTAISNMRNPESVHRIFLLLQGHHMVSQMEVNAI